MVKSKADALNVRVPQNKDECAAMIKEFADVEREVELIDTALKATLANAKASAESEAAPHKARAKELFDGIKLFCEANRAALLGNTGLKSFDFGTGKVAWRWKPAKVTITGDDENAIKIITAKIDAAVTRGDAGAAKDYSNFLRHTVEIDKDAMRKAADLARTIDGVKIGRGGETFEIEAFAPELSEAL